MTAEKTVFLFSGQGSQYAGMGVSLVERYPELKEIFDEASDILGFDLFDKCANAPEEELARTVVSQPAIMAVSLCAAKALELNGITASAAAGHSLGEYAAMVYSGMVSRADGFRLIKARSEAMQKAAEANKGAMYAIIGKSVEEIEKVCEETDGYVLPVNYNSLAQTVIAGEEAAAAAAAETLSAMGARAVKLNVASAFHSKLMQSAADEFKPAAEKITFSEPKIKMFSNITGKELDGIDNMPERLARHIVSPVRFTDELANLNALGYDTYIECGPNKVLSGLVRKTLKGVNIANVQDAESLAKILG
ncbi:MAG: ACP S-malonyltransferase [Oscillospiraceae bacterium]|nr:ACP S-malonyltransferase [Oscillospiraceae bacterium]